MDLELDDDQVALSEAVRSVLAKEWPTAALRMQAEGGGGSDELWQRMVELDWPALTIAEADGGMGLGVVEAALVLERCGAAVVGGPFLPTTALFTPLVDAFAAGEQRAALLGAIASGGTGTAALGALAMAGTGHDVDAAALTMVASPTGDRWHLSGTARAVVEAGSVDRIAVPAAVPGGGIALAIVEREAAGVTIEPTRSLDPSRSLAFLRLDTHVGTDSVVSRLGGADAEAAVRRAVDQAVTLVAAELVGTCSAILAMTLEHVRTREQFGVPIGSFQAVKHRMADAYLALEAARAAVLVAAAAVDEDDPRRRVAASTAKALAGDCAERLTREGIQLHGGIGFTWEHDMHLFVKRAMSSSALLGTAEAHRQRVADLIGLVVD